MLREMTYAETSQRGVCNAETAMDNEKNQELESPRKVGFEERSGHCSFDDARLDGSQCATMSLLVVCSGVG